MATLIYRIWESIENNRPHGLLNRDSDRMTDEQERINDRVSVGVPGYDPKQWVPYDLIVDESGSSSISDWDYFHHTGTSGVFSKRALTVLASCLGDRYEELPVLLNGMQFCCLHCRYQIDCLDTEASEIRYFPGGTEVLRIREFQFHKETIPELAIFSIPEVPAHLYASDGVPEIVADAGLRGFDFELVDGPRAAPTGFYTYQNTLLGFQIDIPDTWSVRTWQKGNLTDETGDVPSIFQVSDDDLPRTCDFKHMFVAVLYRPLGQVDIDASVKLSIWRGGDLEEVLMNNLQAQKTEIRQSGTWQCGRETFQYVDTGKIRFFYARADGDLWFYGVIVGQTPSRFDDAVAVMQSMRLL